MALSRARRRPHDESGIIAAPRRNPLHQDGQQHASGVSAWSRFTEAPACLAHFVYRMYWGSVRGFGHQPREVKYSQHLDGWALGHLHPRWFFVYGMLRLCLICIGYHPGFGIGNGCLGRGDRLGQRSRRDCVFCLLAWTRYYHLL